MTPEPMKTADRPEWARDISNISAQYDPGRGRVMIVPDPEETVGEGGFQYSENTKGNISQLGTVIKVGKEEITLYGFTMPNDYKEGDRVLYSKFAGDDILLFEDGTIRPYLGSELTGSILVKIIMQKAVIGKKA